MKVYDYYIGKKFGENLHEGSGLLAEDKNEAMRILEEEFSLQGMLQWTPVRKNQKKDMYRLSLYEKGDINTYIQDRTKKCKCFNCGRVFRKMTTPGYIDPSEGRSYRIEEDDEYIFCSINCAITQRESEYIKSGSSLDIEYGVIYKITKKSTSEAYIGQTVRSWTLRWWEHFTQGTSPKFQDAIKNTPLEDWSFEIIEKIPRDLMRNNSNLLTELEGKWIRHYNTIEKGFNSKQENSKMYLTEK